MYLTRFVDIFREQGLAETRTFVTRGTPGVPDDEYALFEAYCTDPKCNCRRVMLNVIARRQMVNGPLAAISYAFDREDEYPGPALDPLNYQCEYAEVLLAIVEDSILSDPAYLARLESHYRQVKRAAADPRDPAYRLIRAIDRDAERVDEAAGRRASADLTATYSLVDRVPRSIATRASPNAAGQRKGKSKRRKKRS